MQPAWLVAGAALVALRYMFAAVSLRAAAAGRIPFGRTLLVQVSSGFVGRLMPEGVGWVVLNHRFLEQTGLSRSSAPAAITLKLGAGAITRVLLMASVAALGGRKWGVSP